MANRRMISKGIFQDDRFTDLSATARLLYVYLILEADDDGFISSKKSAFLFAEAKESDLQKLEDKEYIITFPSGICVVRHWLQMNKIQPTRKTPTVYTDELSKLKINGDESYSVCQQNVDNLSTQSSIVQGQGSIGQGSKEKDNTVQGNKKEVDDIDVQIATLLKNESYKAVMESYREKIGNLRSFDEFKQLYNLLQVYGMDDVIDSIGFMAEKGGRSVAYLEKILETN